MVERHAHISYELRERKFCEDETWRSWVRYPSAAFSFISFLVQVMVSVVMTKLQIVDGILRSNTDIVVVDRIENTYLPNTSRDWAQTMDYLVAPKVGIYTAEGLQKFMRGLVPGIHPTSVDDFIKYSSGDVAFGMLYFDEVVGHEKSRRELVLTADDIDGHQFRDGKRTIDATKDLMRRVWVRPYPNEAIARAVADDIGSSLKWCITAGELQRYQELAAAAK